MPHMHSHTCMPRLTPHTRRNPPRSAVVGEVDEEADSNIDYTQVRAAPLKAILH